MAVVSAPIDDPARAFLDHLPTIERVIAIIARRNALGAADADEFGSWARARIIDSDYAIFRKFAGRSSMATYLSVVLGNLFHDYRNSVWGRWRPSVVATRLGPAGVRLEELLYRDGFSLREAIEVLRSAGVPHSDIELARMSTALPLRQPASEVPLELLQGTPSEADPLPGNAGPNEDDFALLRGAIATLTAEEQVIMRMRFWDDTSVADIARALQFEQKPLYRRIEAIESKLRTLLADRGMDRERARDLLSGEVAW